MVGSFYSFGSIHTLDILKQDRWDPTIMLTHLDLRGRIRERSPTRTHELDEASLGHKVPSMRVSKFL